MEPTTKSSFCKSPACHRKPCGHISDMRFMYVPWMQAGQSLAHRLEGFALGGSSFITAAPSVLQVILHGSMGTGIVILPCLLERCCVGHTESL